MSTLSLIIVIVFIGFAIYKIRNYFCRKNKENTNKVVFQEITLDRRFYSSPSFSFPNVCSETDMKLIDFYSDSPNEVSEIKVTEYCKYMEN